MPENRVDDGRLIRNTWPPGEFDIVCNENELILRVPKENAVARAQMSKPLYPTELSLLRTAIRGLILRAGGFARWGTWHDRLQLFVDRWLKQPTNSAGDPALERRMAHHAPVVVSLRQAPMGIIGIQVSLQIYVADLVHSTEEIIYEPERLQRIGVSPLPLGRNSHAVYCLLDYIVTAAVEESWGVNNMHAKMRRTIDYFLFGGMEPRHLEIATRTGANE